MEVLLNWFSLSVVDIDAPVLVEVSLLSRRHVACVSEPESQRKTKQERRRVTFDRDCDQRHAEDAKRREEKQRAEVRVGQKTRKNAAMTRPSWVILPSSSRLTDILVFGVFDMLLTILESVAFWISSISLTFWTLF